MLSLLILTGCGSFLSAQNQYTGPDAGRVVIGIGASKDAYFTSYGLLFKKLNSEITGRFIYFSDSTFITTKPYYSTESEHGVVQSFNLPPGEYEIYDVDFYANGGLSQKSYNSSSPISIKFTINPGKVSYLGNYRAKDIRGKNTFGITITGGAFYTVSDRMLNDISLVSEITQGVTSFANSNFTPDVNAIASPLFVLEKK